MLSHAGKEGREIYKTLPWACHAKISPPKVGPAGKVCQNWSPRTTFAAKSVRPDQFWQPKLVPLANFGPPVKIATI